MTRSDVGFGGASERPLPPMPPPPRSLPFEKLNGGQVILRVIIVVIVAWLVAVIAKQILHETACMMPDSPFCTDGVNRSNSAP